jgi:(2Fe-2S) ferredoxin
MKGLSKICFVPLIVLLALAMPVIGETWTVDDDGADCPTADFTHPQDAVNAAAPYDTILVYPGTYDSRECSCGTEPEDNIAPALIVYKDGLTIQAVDPDAASTIIQSTHDEWSNPVAVESSTGGAVVPSTQTAPSAIAIIASNVTISSFTIRKPNVDGDPNLAGFWNTAGVMIGGLYLGDADNLGSDENTVVKCVFENVWHAVLIWHSSNNMVVNNYVAPLGITDSPWGIEIYDGADDADINLGYTGKDNKIVNNTLSDKGIFVGAWGNPGPTVWADNSGTKVHSNNATGLFTGFSSGKKIFSGNKVAFMGAAFASDYKYPGESNSQPPSTWKASLPYAP